jgi:hypothetical protein
MATCKRLVLQHLFGMIGLASLALVAARVSANECAHFTSTGARAQGELRLCEHSVDGAPATFACREYRDADFRYLLLFKGGPLPKAIYRHESGQGMPNLRVAQRFEAAPESCRQQPPPGVPASAVYRGTGVCLDANDRPVPCSVYEHAAARRAHAMRYLVLYDPRGAGPIDIDAQVAGDNANALLAELAFQMGLQLLNGECCREQAQGYLAYALELFPDDPLYRAAYREGLASARAREALRQQAPPTTDNIATVPASATVTRQDTNTTAEIEMKRVTTPGVGQSRSVPRQDSP